LLAASPDAETRHEVLLRRAGPNSWTALHAAAARGAVGVITALLEKEGTSPAGASPEMLIEAVDREGRTALQLASAGNHAAASRELLRWGASRDGLSISELDAARCDHSGALVIVHGRADAAISTPEPPRIVPGTEQLVDVHVGSLQFEPPAFAAVVR
jgi:hypothetical protein